MGCTKKFNEINIIKNGTSEEKNLQNTGEIREEHIIKLRPRHCLPALLPALYIKGTGRIIVDGNLYYKGKLVIDKEADLA